MLLDIKTIVFINIIVCAINVITALVLWRQYRARFGGISCWLGWTLCIIFGAILIISRGRLPDFIAILLANALLNGGGALMVDGVERFVGRTRLFKRTYVVSVAYVFFIAYFTWLKPSLAAREIGLSLATVFLYAHIWWVLITLPRGRLRRATRSILFVASATVIVNSIRAAYLAFFPAPTNDLFKTSFVDSLTIICYLSLNIWLMIALVMAVSGRLLDDVRAQEEKFSKAFHSAPYAVILTRLADGRILEANERFMKSTGYRREEVIGKTSVELGLWGRDADRHELVRSLAHGGGRAVDREAEFRVKSGEILIGHFSAELLEINEERCLLITIRNVTEEILMKRRLEDLATHDALTGLPNRRLLMDHFELASANARRAKNKIAVLSLDMDRFKTINDSYGHATGDAVLVESGRRLMRVLRKGDTVARIGGDEFVILLGGLDRGEDAAEVAQKILAEFRWPFIVDDREFTLSVSIGIALSPDSGTDLDALLRTSDKAMYGVKEKGRNGFQVA